MVRSMTGFGRGQVTYENLEVTVEVKSVNHRYFEFSAKVPRSYNFLEEKLKSFCGAKISRGKVEIYVSVDNKAGAATVVEINEDVARAFVDAYKTLSKKHKIKNDVTTSVLAAHSDVLSLKRQVADEETVTAAVMEAAEIALNEFIAMRETEGERLKNDILSKLDAILERVAYIEQRSPETVKAYRERLEAKIKELLSGAQFDEQRIITETAIFADKVAVDEETVRLRSHIAQLKNMFELNESIGRKLDFIVQEMNRETNTIGSKAQDADILQRVVDTKSDIEKIREQLQNIE
ncbi:MAG: YicC family protein [Ruminococcaceae bacterium]|nr:YicC family protein [Oscillospiraceae bacterium]